jgi:PAS domain S-box-containing protein
MRKIITYLCLLILLTATAAYAEPLRISIFPFSPPFSYHAVSKGQRELTGYTVDECLAIGKLLNREIEFVETSSIERQASWVSSGDVPVIAHDSRDYATRHDLTFLPVGVSLQHHLYRNIATPPGINLKVPASWKNLHFVEVKGAPYVDEIPDIPGAIQAPSALEALHLLNEGVADVFIAPSERVADHIIEFHNMRSVKKEGSFIGEAPLGLIVNPNNTELIRQLTGAIKTLEKNGSLARIRGKWFNAKEKPFFIRYASRIAWTSIAVAIAFLCFTLWNISLKRRVEKVTRALRRTEQRYRNLIESSPDMIFLVSENGDVLHANERARSHMLPGTDLAGLNIRDIVSAEDREEIGSFLAKVFHDGCDKHEFRMDERDERSLEVEIAGRLIQGADHAGQLACLFARNVTERNRMEEELIQSERLAIIGKMAAGVAHEINNPLGIIRFNAEDLLYAEEMSADAKDGLTAISRNAARAADTITHMLELASPKPLKSEPFNLEDALRDSIALMGPKLKRTRISVDMTNTPLAMRGDPRAIQQVLVNIFLNALNSMDGKGNIAIKGQKTAQGVRLEVADEGKGIPREDLARIFEPFFTSRDNGFGLGLFMTRRIVERHEGIIFAESESGKGTRMILEFPTPEEETL